MTSSGHSLTVSEAVQITGLTQRQITYACKSGRLTFRKLPGRTGAYLLDPHEVRTYAEIVGDSIPAKK